VLSSKAPPAGFCEVQGRKKQPAEAPHWRSATCSTSSACCMSICLTAARLLTRIRATSPENLSLDKFQVSAGPPVGLQRLEEDLNLSYCMVHEYTCGASTSFPAGSELVCASFCSQRLEEDMDLSHYNSAWADSKSLKNALTGIGAIQLRPTGPYRAM